MRSRRVRSHLAACREQFAEPYFVRYEEEFLSSRAANWGCATLVLVPFSFYVAVAAYPLLYGAWLTDFEHWRHLLIPFGIAVAFFLLFLSGQIANFRESWEVRVVPYYERPVGDIDTLMSGEAYVRHSRIVDERAVRHGVRPLSEFLSPNELGMGPGDRPTFFDAAGGRGTVDRLPEPDIAADLPPEVIADLRRWQTALTRASDQDIRFCLNLRTWSGLMQGEEERLHGSFS